MGAFGVFGLCQIHAFVDYLRSHLNKNQFDILFRAVISTIAITGILTLVVLAALGKIAPWTGRFYSLLDPSYAKNNIPIIASVSEHQPTAWSSFYFDLQMLTFMFPVGLYFCFSNLTDENIFIILYGVLSIYFAGVMVRLMLVLAPVMCILSGIAVSSLLSTYMKQIDEVKVEKKKQRFEGNYFMRSEIATLFVCVMSVFLVMYTLHCTWVTSEAYSSPSIVLSARGHDGSRIIFDDFREAYYWLRHNTPERALRMSLRSWAETVSPISQPCHHTSNTPQSPQVKSLSTSLSGVLLGEGDGESGEGDGEPGEGDGEPGEGDGEPGEGGGGVGPPLLDARHVSPDVEAVLDVSKQNIISTH
ncbi:hypothetical protein Pcinc_009538 [Petrolisthes cinctipes]|uniref:Dolichyl-diphosphooligosaccharide--protein glycosyltransferase subunit STT3A n=1 Tax=Petrolisthes cinctipes TaxID=88211 RepID=A0AAE1G6S5_PETCI|nr:hypothetical protein Pcinc_009538 [Petrolisthes cinctipes]